MLGLFGAGGGVGKDSLCARDPLSCIMAACRGGQAGEVEPPECVVTTESVFREGCCKKSGGKSDEAAGSVYVPGVSDSADDAGLGSGGAVGDAVFGEVVRPAKFFDVVVTIPRSSTPMKLHLEALESGVFRINAVRPGGPFDTAAAGGGGGAAPEAEFIAPGDGIVAADGEAVRIERLTAGGEMLLTICRPARFTVRGLVSSEGELGVKTACLMGSTAIFLADVLPGGLIGAHNLRSPSLAVHPGDMIVAVNGQEAGSVRLFKMIREADVLDLTIDRFAQAAEPAVPEETP